MNEFAAAWTLDPSVEFLNHGSFGATPRVVLEHQSELRGRLEAEPVRFMLRDLPELWERARTAAADFVGADRAGLVFVTNATTGVNTVLASLDLEPGDELLVTNHEYGACRNALDRIAAERGATVRVVELGLPVARADDVVKTLGDAIGPKTRLLLVDHVTSATGMVLPIAKIAAACRERGVRIVVDGAHAPGMVDLDLESLGVDYYTGNLHKWLCTPKSVAILWSAPEHRDSLRPLVTSHGASTPTRSAAERLHVEFDWQGTIDPTPVLCVPVTIEHLGSLIDGGWRALRDRNRLLALEARGLLQDALDADPLCPDGMIGSLAAVRVSDANPDRSPDPFELDPLQASLFDEHRIEVPVHNFGPHRLLRVSAQLYNDREQYVRLAGALRRLLG